MNVVSTRPQGELKGSIRGQEETELTVSCGASNKVFSYTDYITKKNNLPKKLLDTRWNTNLLQFQKARPDQVLAESSRCCFPSELVNFDPHFPLTRKHISVGRSNN